ncbi:uncharacterized protein LOC111052190 [Nilaparvata lugens]|uniref:uncharacterized protein LOC111052190 n=1 Tax=Nilaparvata lugens TaxID=108931 RepID=UPI000B99856E|nr:uncharacterized protein LOC111052190 [Nilaparvata lugens]
MFALNVFFSLYVACTLLSTIITSVPVITHNFSGERKARGISDELQGVPDDNHQHPTEAAETTKTTGTFALSRQIFCQLCSCPHWFDLRCVELKCCDEKSDIVRDVSNMSISLTTSDATAEQNVNTDMEDTEVLSKEADQQKKVIIGVEDRTSEVVPVGTIDSTKSTSECYSNVSETEKFIPSKPATFDSDVSNETNPVSNGASVFFNSWTVVFIVVLASTSLFSALRYAKRWRREQMRENYLIDGLYSEARPLCLNDMLD